MIALKADLAVDLLAERLHWKLEHLDPTDGAVWADLSPHEQEVFKTCVWALLAERTAIFQALGVNLTDHLGRWR